MIRNIFFLFLIFLFLISCGKKSNPEYQGFKIGQTITYL